MKLYLKYISIEIYLYNNILITLYIITLKFGFYFNQIYDNFTINVLEEGNQLLDVTDYHNFSLIVTTGKNMCTGIPPKLKTKTNANLINSTSLITINDNYLLAACLQDSLLTKINLNNGSFSSLLNYSYISDIQLEIPITSCSLSIIEDTIFIGFTQINYFETETNKTNIIIKVNITDKDSNNGPIFDTSVNIKYFIFPNSTIKTNSVRQISCEPLKIKMNKTTISYRLVCLHETMEFASDGFNRRRFYIYATAINENLDGFEIKFNEIRIFRVDDNSGFRIYKLNDYKARCIMKKEVYDLSLEISSQKIKINKEETKSKNIRELTADLDLFDYNNGLVFYSEKVSFMNKSDIYYFRINRESSKIYFKLYDYKEIKIKRILCYYNIKSEYIIFLYQSSMYIKYFSLINNNNIYNINSSNSKIFELKSNEEIEYDINELLEISKIGHLNIDQVIINKNGKSYTENFAINFFQLLVNNNKLVIGKNYKNWYNYSLSLFEHIENNYTRIYHLNQIIIIVKTCFSNKCQTCNKDYYKCDFIEKPAEYYQDPDSCFGIFNNKCYPRCPEGTCLNQDDIELINCIPIEENITVLNYICFRDLEELKNNIKYISEIDEPIMTRPDIIIKGYSTNSIYEKIQNNANYSIINLGECVNKLKIYYNLSNDTELYIFGVDSPSKNKSYITSVYNYEVLLENGTQIDHYKVCKDNKITVSSLIRNTSLAKLDEAIYFSEFGYDIYNKSSRFYTDNCAPASINGNDITLEDRIREFYPSNISICNESCYYISVNFTSKRFICECELEYNFSLNYINVNNNEEEEDTTYFDYFLSLINYKITVCYALFFDFKSYYYNAGFYIAFGTLVFCIIGMIIFLKYGIADLNKIFLENIPNKMKLIKSFKEQEAKRKELQIEFEINCNNINNPIKKNKLEEKKILKEIILIF